MNCYIFVYVGFIALFFFIPQGYKRKILFIPVYGFKLFEVHSALIIYFKGKNLYISGEENNGNAFHFRPFCRISA